MGLKKKTINLVKKVLKNKNKRKLYTEEELLYELEDAKILAGGQSLIPLMNFRLASPMHLIDISGLAELSEIKVSETEVEIGASVTHS